MELFRYDLDRLALERTQRLKLELYETKAIFLDDEATEIVRATLRDAVERALKIVGVTPNGS